MSVTKIIPRVNVNVMDANVLSSQSVRIKEDILPSDISMVSIPQLGTIPAVVALKTTLVGIRHSEKGAATHDWRVVVSPHETQLLTRLLGVSQGRLVDSSAQSPQIQKDLVEKLRQSHTLLSGMEPPIGTTVQIVMAFTKLGKVEMEWEASSLVVALQKRKLIIRENKLLLIRAGIWGWFSFWRNRHLETEPPEPESDEWLDENRLELKMILNMGFVPVLESLWKATFNEGDVAAQLRRDGYELDRIGRTVIGSMGLGDLIQERRGRLTHLTQLDHDD